MSIPLQITFHELPSSPAVEAQIRERAESLERHCDRLISCRVIVEGRHRAQRPTQQFHLRVGVRPAAGRRSDRSTVAASGGISRA